jgi:transposase InsO family protein
VSAATSPETGRRYGIKRICTAWELPRSTWYAQQLAASPERPPPGKRGPKTCHSDGTLLAAIGADLAASPFVGEGHRKVWARLRFGGLRTSKARVLRLMREHGLLAPHRVGPARGPRSHDGTIIPAAPDVMWGTDLTTTVLTSGRQVAVFVCVDHFSAEFVGVHAAERATRWEALEPVRQGVREVFRRIDAGAATGLSLRHDNGSQYVADDFQREIAFLGIESSPSFVRAPEGNGCAERIIRTLKEQLLWVRSFATVEELRIALEAWRHLYNNRWLIERHGHQPPAQVRRDYVASVQREAA